MSTYTQLLYQIVFSTKSRKKSLAKENRAKLYKYIWGIIKNKNCTLYRIGGVEDHIHIIVDIKPSIAISYLVKDIKVASSKLIKSEKLFPLFDGWQVGFSVFSYSIEAKNNLVQYVMNQEEHHKNVSYNNEIRGLLIEHKVPFDERYLG